MTKPDAASVAREAATRMGGALRAALEARGRASHRPVGGQHAARRLRRAGEGARARLDEGRHLLGRRARGRPDRRAQQLPLGEGDAARRGARPARARAPDAFGRARSRRARRRPTRRPSPAAWRADGARLRPRRPRASATTDTRRRSFRAIATVDVTDRLVAAVPAQPGREAQADPHASGHPAGAARPGAGRRRRQAAPPSRAHGPREGDVHETPSRIIRDCEGAVTWIVDEAACRLMPSHAGASSSPPSSSAQPTDSASASSRTGRRSVRSRVRAGSSPNVRTRCSTRRVSPPVGQLDAPRSGLVCSARARDLAPERLRRPRLRLDLDRRAGPARRGGVRVGLKLHLDVAAVDPEQPELARQRGGLPSEARGEPPEHERPLGAERRARRGGLHEAHARDRDRQVARRARRRTCGRRAPARGPAASTPAPRCRGAPRRAARAPSARRAPRLASDPFEASRTTRCDHRARGAKAGSSTRTRASHTSVVGTSAAQSASTQLATRAQSAPPTRSVTRSEQTTVPLPGVHTAETDASSVVGAVGIEPDDDRRAQGRLAGPRRRWGPIARATAPGTTTHQVHRAGARLGRLARARGRRPQRPEIRVGLREDPRGAQRVAHGRLQRLPSRASRSSACSGPHEPAG